MTEAVEIHASDGHVAVQGPLTFSTVPSLVSRAREWLDQCQADLEIDLSGVAHTDSAGVALLLEWWNTAHQLQRNLRYTKAPVQVQEFIRINGLGKTLLG